MDSKFQIKVIRSDSAENVADLVRLFTIDAGVVPMNVTISWDFSARDRDGMNQRGGWVAFVQYVG